MAKKSRTGAFRKLKLKPSTRQHILAASGNTCAFSSCNALIFDLEHNVLVGEIAHIKGEKPSAARYDPSQSPEERRSAENLLALCREHHVIVDSREDVYAVEVIERMKGDHEAKIAAVGDRSWLVPPNSIHRLEWTGETLVLRWWRDKTGRPRVYSAEQLAILDVLMQLNLDLDNLGQVYELLPTLNSTTVDSLLQQGYAKLSVGDKKVYSKLLQLMAMVPDVTFGEFLRLLVQGHDATEVIEEGVRRLADRRKGGRRGMFGSDGVEHFASKTDLGVGKRKRVEAAVTDEQEGTVEK